MKQKISVFGGDKANEKVCKLAEKAGKMIAELGYILVCGGHGGVMKYSAKGAKEAGGETIGITFRDLTKDGYDVNKYIDKKIVAKDYFERLQKLCDVKAIVVLLGELGTLAELFVAWNYQRVKKPKIPIVLIDQEKCYSKLINHIKRSNCFNLKEKYYQRIKIVKPEILDSPQKFGKIIKSWKQI